MENSQKCRFLLQVVCGNAGIIFFRKPGFLQIGVFTKYRWFNATKWPQMPQKRKRTIPHGSGHTLGTLNHGLGPLFGCFITFLAPGVASTPLAPCCQLLRVDGTYFRPPKASLQFDDFPWEIFTGMTSLGNLNLRF